MERLEKKSSYYQERLKALSQFNEEYDVVVKEKADTFIIYKELKSGNIGLGITHFKALVYFKNDKTILRIVMKKNIKLILTVLFTYGLILSCILIYRGDFSFLFSMFVLMIAVIAIRINRTKFKKFIIVFFNSI